MKQKVINLVNEQINPKLAQHKGSCEIVDVVGTTVKIKLTGGCSGCKGRKMTFYNGIVPFMKQHIPEIENVELID